MLQRRFSTQATPDLFTRVGFGVRDMPIPVLRYAHQLDGRLSRAIEGLLGPIARDEEVQEAMRFLLGTEPQANSVVHVHLLSPLSEGLNNEFIHAVNMPNRTGGRSLHVRVADDVTGVWLGLSALVVGRSIRNLFALPKWRQAFIHELSDLSRDEQLKKEIRGAYIEACLFARTKLADAGKLSFAQVNALLSEVRDSTLGTGALSLLLLRRCVELGWLPSPTTTNMEPAAAIVGRVLLATRERAGRIDDVTERFGSAASYPTMATMMGLSPTAS